MLTLPESNPLTSLPSTNLTGQVWWEAFARNGQAGVAGGSSRVFARPIPLAITYASRVTVRDIKIVQSPFWHSLCFYSQDVLMEDITYSSKSYNSTVRTKNSDALDIYNCDRVTCVYSASLSNALSGR